MTIKDDIARLEKRVETLGTEVSDLRRFQSWLTGIAVGVGAIFGLVAETVKKKIGLS